MSFPAAIGILMPEELDIVQRVFSDIASEDWFTRSEQRREHFALSVIDAYRSGVIDPKLLKRQCLRIAKVEFGNGGMAY